MDLQSSEHPNKVNRLQEVVSLGTTQSPPLLSKHNLPCAIVAKEFIQVDGSLTPLTVYILREEGVYTGFGSIATGARSTAGTTKRASAPSPSGDAVFTSPTSGRSRTNHAGTLAEPHRQ